MPKDKKPKAKRVSYRESVFEYETTIYEGGTGAEQLFARLEHMAKHGLAHNNVEAHAKLFLEALNSLGLGPSEEGHEYYLNGAPRGMSKGSLHWKYLPIDEENAPQIAIWADKALTLIKILIDGQKRHPLEAHDSESPGFWFSLGREIEELEIKIRLHAEEKTVWSQRKVQAKFKQYSQAPRKSKIDPKTLKNLFPELFDPSVKERTPERGKIVAKAAKHFGVTAKAIRERVRQHKDGS